MKKSYIRIIAAAASVLLLASCQVNETDFDGNKGVIGKNTIAFSLGGVDTRSSVAISDITEPGVTIPLGTDESGTNFYLEESVVDLNSPLTRGTPAYTENVVALYGKQLFAHSALGDDTYNYDEDTKCYIKSYGKNIWGEGSTLKFWMYMPVALTDYGVTATPSFGETSGKQTISFSYVSPTTAAGQADMIFSTRTITESEYDDNDKVMDVLFQHALTGVKFRIGNEDDMDEFDIKINSISFSGLYDKGDCIVTPTPEDGKYKDIADNYSSAATGTVVWSNLTSTGSVISSGDYGDLVEYAEGAGSFKTEGYGYPESFSAKSNDKNLNDDDATQTFWLIPQTLDADVKLTVNYSVGENDHEWTIDFGKALANLVWKPGQLRTYTIRIDEVNVQIDDNVNVVTADDVVIEYKDPFSGDVEYYSLDSYEGSTKTDVTIANTGNTDAYIRAAIVGQWLDEDGNPVFGFTDYTAGKVVLVDSWYQDQFGTNAQHEQGKFTGLPGDNWVKGDDGYYYYTAVVPAGETIPDALFTEYKVGTPPGVAIAGEAPQIYFRLEIATQAISAKKQNGETYTPYTAAWNNAKAQE